MKDMQAIIILIEYKNTWYLNQDQVLKQVCLKKITILG